MRKILYFITGLAIIGMIIGSIFSFLPVFTITGNNFLTTVSQGRFEQAYTFLSENYQKKQTLDQFTALMKEKQLDNFKSVNWIKNVTNDDKISGFVVGIVTTQEGESVTIQLNFKQKNSDNFFAQAWQIDDILFQ